MKQFAFLLPKRYKVDEIENLLRLDDEVEQKELQEGLNKLAKKGWLQYTKEGYSMHRMIQQMVHYQLEPKLTDIEVLINKLTELLSFDSSTEFSKLFIYIPYAEFVLTQLEGDNLNYSEVSLLQHNLSVVMERYGEYEKAKDLLESGLENAVKNLGEDSLELTVYRSSLANVYKALKQYEKARDLLEIILATAIKNFGEQHQHVDVYRSSLAVVHNELGEYQKAIDLLEIALASAIKNFGEQHSTVATRYSNLGNVYLNLGDYAKAKDLLETALKIDLKNLGEQHTNVAIRFGNLAWVYFYMNNFKKAKGCFEKALEIFQKNLGQNHPHTKGAAEGIEYMKSKMKE